VGRRHSFAARGSLAGCVDDLPQDGSANVSPVWFRWVEGAFEVVIAEGDDRVRDWAKMGDFSPAGLGKKDFYIAVVEGRMVGWAAAIGQGDVWWLDDLWIEHEWIGKGIGSRLFRHAAEEGRRAGAVRMEWEAEPNALGFYEQMEGRYLRDGEAGVWGRGNAVMGLDLL
jgi:GNAT superfamily N-acetyltransferase